MYVAAQTFHAVNIRGVYSGCARHVGHTPSNWLWRDIFQIVRSR